MDSQSEFEQTSLELLLEAGRGGATLLGAWYDCSALVLCPLEIFDCIRHQTPAAS